MADWRSLGRALGAGFVAFALGACAADPAPVAMRGDWRPGRVAPPYNPDAPPRILDGTERLQCVPFARNASGVQLFGDANTWWAQAAGRYPRSNSPAPGAVLVTRGYRDASRGHVAVVASVVNERLILVDHANWLNGGEVSVSVPVTDVSPQNDWSEVRVWYAPLQALGGTHWPVHGFIYPDASARMMAASGMTRFQNGAIAVAQPASAPSSSAMRCSNISTVGLEKRLYIWPLSSPRKRAAASSAAGPAPPGRPTCCREPWCSWRPATSCASRPSASCRPCGAS